MCVCEYVYEFVSVSMNTHVRHIYPVDVVGQRAELVGVDMCVCVCV